MRGTIVVGFIVVAMLLLGVTARSLLTDEPMEETPVPTSTVRRDEPVSRPKLRLESGGSRLEPVPVAEPLAPADPRPSVAAAPSQPSSPKADEGLDDLPSTPPATAQELTQLTENTARRARQLEEQTDLPPETRSRVYLDGVQEIRGLWARTAADTPERSTVQEAHARLARAFAEAGGETPD